MTYQQAVEFIDQYDLRVLVLPAHKGFAVFRPMQSHALRALAYADTFETAVESAQTAVEAEQTAPNAGSAQP